MKLGHIEIFVKDPLKSKDFYGEVLGFEVTDVQDDKFVWLKYGSAEILLRPGKTSESPPTYQDASTAIVFYTDNLDQSVDELKKRGLEFRGIDGSERCLTFTDPDGHWFQLVNPNEH
ncbi:VOC family protein [candidate division TA06 bacterium]|nr:VOC family protein [candidate division TA06 bacterium]